MSSFARFVSAIDFYSRQLNSSRAGRVACRIDLVSQTIRASTSISASLSFQFFSCAPCCESQVHHLCHQPMRAKDGLAALRKSYGPI